MGLTSQPFREMTVNRFSTALFAIAVCVAVPRLHARWISTGPFGGSAEVVVVDPADQDFLIAATKNAVFYGSRNAGSSWQPIHFPRQYVSMLHAVIFHPTQPSTFYAAIADDSLPGLYKTTDGGASWNAVTGLGKGEVYSLAFFPGNPNIMAAGLRHGVWLSRDGGSTWNSISPADDAELQPVVSVAFDPENVGTIYAGTPRLPWKTTDGGANWDLIAEGMSTDSDIIALRVDASRPSRVLIGACSGFWRSNNAGALWSKMSGIPFTSRRTYAFAQDSERPELIFAGTSRGLYRTEDGGATWVNLCPNEIKSLAISGSVLYVATGDRGLLKSSDKGATLQPINEGFTSRNLTRLAERGEHLYTSTNFEADSGGLFSSSDSGLHWERVTDPARLGYENVIAVARTAGAMLVATRAGLFRSTDAGATWNKSKELFGGGKLTSIAALDEAVLVASDTGIYRSTDDGVSWSAVAGSRRGVTNLMYAGPVVAVLPGELLVSNDQGATWASRHLPFFVEVYDVAVAGNHLIAGTSRGVFRSDDQAETWRAAESGLPRASITTVAIDPVGGQLAYAFEFGNVYESRDAGRTWQRFDKEGLGGASIRNFVITTEGRRNLIALTNTRGIFVRELDEIASPKSSFSAVQLRKDRYVPSQQNKSTPAS